MIERPEIQIRPAVASDVPAIVGLLKAALGETSSPKTAAYWHWKHIENPFGQSPVLLAFHKEKLVGVRAFLRWQWQHEGTIYSALRAVDTGTHPDYQGLGIFKKLTLSLVENCVLDGDHFIYNTPNTQSMPGYLKMGWKQLGKIPVLVKPRFFSLIKNALFNAKNDLVDKLGLKLKPLGNWLDFDESIAYSLHGKSHIPMQVISPVFPKGFFRWRYADCPIQQYYYIQEETFTIIFYPRLQGRFLELRITELISLDENAILKAIRSISTIAAQIGADFISMSHQPQIKYRFLALNGFLPKLPIGPIITIRPLNNTPKPFQDIEAWWLPMGTMELF